jgi:hypothetical protein
MSLRKASCASLTQLAQLCLRLLQPVGHAHFAVHRHRGGNVLLGLLAISPAAVNFAATHVAMGDKRAHAARLGVRHGLAIVAFSVLGAGDCGDVTHEAEGVGLAAPSARPTAEVKDGSGVIGELPCAAEVEVSLEDGSRAVAPDSTREQRRQQAEAE